MDEIWEAATLFSYWALELARSAKKAEKKTISAAEKKYEQLSFNHYFISITNQFSHDLGAAQCIVSQFVLISSNFWWLSRKEKIWNKNESNENEPKPQTQLGVKN
jgi:hypothetical protein